MCFAFRRDFSWWAPTHLTGAKEMVGFHLLGVCSFVSEEQCPVWGPPEKIHQQTGVIWAVIICKQPPKIQAGRKPQSLLVRQEQSLDRVVSVISGACVMERHAFLLSHGYRERQGVGNNAALIFYSIYFWALTLGEGSCQAGRVWTCSERGRAEERVRAGPKTSSFCSLPISGPFLGVQDDSEYISEVNQQGLRGEQDQWLPSHGSASSQFSRKSGKMRVAISITRNAQANFKF